MNTANSKGIGLIKIMPEEKFQVVIELVTLKGIDEKLCAFPEGILPAILDSNYISCDESVYGIDNGYCFGAFEQMLHNHLKSI